MKKIMCFVEQESKEFEAFAEKYESEAVYLYDHFISMFSGDITVFCDEIEKERARKEDYWFLTDNKAFYTLVQELFPAYFEKQIYLDTEAKADSRIRFDVYKHMDAELAIQTEIQSKELLNRLCDLRFETDDGIYELFAKDLQSEIESRQNAIWWNHICTSLLKVENLSQESDGKYYLFLLSIIMQLIPDAEKTNRFLEEYINHTKEYKESGYYLWNQFKAFSFLGTIQWNASTDRLLDRIYENSYNEYWEQAKSSLVKIPYHDRDQDLVFVLTIQFLEKNHAPTKTVRERIKGLCKLGKKVILINTTEQYLAQGYIPCYNTRVGTVIDSYNQINHMQIGEYQVGFVQMHPKLPMDKRIEIIVSLLQKARPAYILSIGTGSMIADICGKMIPTAAMGLVFSKLPHTINAMKIIGKTLRREEKEKYPKDIIESRFTFELKPQKKKLTRQELHIPERKFVLAVVGIRLDYDVNRTFLELLEKVCKEDCFVVFAGKMEQYTLLVKDYPAVQKNSVFVGYQDDILALMELVDLYVNPKRFGGGFSVIEAFYKGVPGVYLKSGDVYVAGGEEFALDDYMQMEQEILHYQKDRTFYEERSQKARQRAKLMTSSEDAIRDLNTAIEQRVRENYW